MILKNNVARLVSLCKVDHYSQKIKGKSGFMKTIIKLWVFLCLFFAAGFSPVFSSIQNEGSLRILSYNIAGLHNIISPLKNRKNMTLIGEKINDFDIVLLQENFSYSSLLMETTNFPFWQKADTRGLLGSGLMRLSRFPFWEFYRYKWPKCSGIFSKDSDCLAKKGFTFSRYEVSPGVFIDVYNIHSDAGRHKKDKKARLAQLNFLAAKIKENSKGRAVIIGGDWNLLHDDEDDQLIFGLFMVKNKFRYMCSDLRCSETGQGALDRFVFRDGKKVSLKQRHLALPSELNFYDQKGIPLSDHDPLLLELDWFLKD